MPSEQINTENIGLISPAKICTFLENIYQTLRGFPMFLSKSAKIMIDVFLGQRPTPRGGRLQNNVIWLLLKHRASDSVSAWSPSALQFRSSKKCITRFRDKCKTRFYDGTWPKGNVFRLCCVILWSQIFPGKTLNLDLYSARLAPIFDASWMSYLKM